jgi:Cof subfamily protein (haloacid dehalogenase superfamily)
MSGDTPIRLVISDIDGTLVHSDKSLSDATIAAVGRLTAAGMPMSLISARPPSGMQWIADKLDLDGPFGAFNGGTLFTRDGNVIEQHRLNRAVAEATLAIVRDAGITCWVFADGNWYASKATDRHNPREVKAANVQPIITEDFAGMVDRIDKIVGVSDDHPLLIRLEEETIRRAGQGATVARSQPYYLDVTAPVANKGDGIAFLARAYGVDLAEVAVIGDQANDLPMFARAGFSIVMGQAPDPVKAKATVTTSAADDDGVAHAIDTIILPRLRGG